LVQVHLVLFEKKKKVGRLFWLYSELQSRKRKIIIIIIIIKEK